MYVYVCVHSEYVCTDVVYFYLIPIFPTRCCGTPFSVLFGIVVQCYCILPPKVLTGSPETEGGCSRLSSPLPVLSSVQFSLVLAFHLPRQTVDCLPGWAELSWPEGVRSRCEWRLMSCRQVFSTQNP